jgi:hypothetical protein
MNTQYPPIASFPAEVCEALGNYVYRLIDPRNGETFYVGKGKGNRVFQHAMGVKATAAEDEESILGPKYDRIRAIKNAGLDVVHVIHRHGIHDKAVFEVEAAVIDAYPGLSNIQGGHGSGDRGPMNHRQLLDKFALPTLEDAPKEKLILININALEDLKDRASIYEQVRFAWRLSRARAEKADYVLAVVRGVVIGAFKANEWKRATRSNFPEVPHAKNDDTERYAFRGTEAPPEIWERFVGQSGKRIASESLRHVQNPIRYWNC